MASTRISPIRRRVSSEEDIPRRLRSRNSTRLNWEPTETISRAPFSAAISIATSPLVPGAGTSLNASPSSLRRSLPGRPAIRVGVHRPAPRRSAAPPPPPNPCRRRSCRAPAPRPSSASAAPSTATITGRMSRMNGRRARRSLWWPTPRTTTSVGRSRKSVAKRGRPIRPVSSSRSSRMCSIVLWAKLSSASATSRRRASVSSPTRCGSSSSPRASTCSRHSTSTPHSPRGAERARIVSGCPSLTFSNSPSSGRSTSSTPASTSSWGPRFG